MRHVSWIDGLMVLMLLVLPFVLATGLQGWALWRTYKRCPQCGARMFRDRQRCPHCASTVPRQQAA